MMLELLGQHNALVTGPRVKEEAKVSGDMFSIRKDPGEVYHIMQRI
jgi:hypothetical protein